ncbi:MAG: LPS export ABC transporter periplasmic protein LptC [Deltaproteobacteria bacterium]|nr:LPS export ABC transporter periplasmic protein LptC [Deltaproteobacteria bacterium]
MKLRDLLWQIPLLVLISMPFWWSTAADFLTIPPMVAGHGSPDNSLEMQDAVMQQSNNGRDDLRLHAAKMYSRDDRRLIYMDNVRARIGNTAAPVMVKSGTAVYNTSREIITLRNDVEITNKDLVIKTTVMRYLAKYRIAKSAAAVQAVGRDMRVSGTSFMYDLRSGDFRIGSRVHFESL